MTIVLSAVVGAGVTLDIGPAALPEAPGGISLRFGLYDGPLTFTLTCDEARVLREQIEGQLTEGANAGGNA